MAKKRDDEGMRKRLIEAATVVFSKQSHLEASMTEVAAEAGLAKGTIYLYFKNKDELIIEMFRHCVDQCRQETRSHLELSPTATSSEQLCQAMRFFLLSAGESRSLWGLWFHFMALSASEKFRSTILKICQDDSQNLASIFTEILERGIASGEFRQDLDLPSTALACFSLTTGFLHLAFIEAVKDVNTLAQLAIEQVIQGLQAERFSPALAG
jgi:AcrR family transcriptional regulator